MPADRDSARKPPSPQNDADADVRSLVERADALRRTSQSMREDTARIREQTFATRARFSAIVNGAESRSQRLAALNLLDDAETARRMQVLEAYHRERAEADARANADRYRRLFESMNEGFAVLEHSDAFRVVECNPAFLRLLNVDHAVGLAIQELLPSWAEPHYAALERVVDASEAVQFEIRWQGEDRWFSVSASRIGGPRDDRVAVVLADVTQRKAAEMALRKSEIRLRALADAIPQIIVSYDAQGRIEYFNRRWYEYSRLTPAQSRDLGWISIVHPDDATAAREGWERALANGTEFEGEFRLRNAHGSYRWFLGRSLPLRDDKGELTGWIGSATDIHDLKLADQSIRASEEQLRRAIEDAPIPVIMHAENGQVLQISRTWTMLTGYTREDMSNFDGWVNRAYGAGAERLRDYVQRLFNGNTAVVDTEIDIITRAGQTRRWAFSASAPGRLRDGRRFVVGMALDITARTHAEEALRASQERLRLIVDNAREYAIFSLDLARRVTSWNTGAQTITGFSAEEVLGNSGDVIFTPEDRAKGAPEREAYTAMTADRASDERWHVRKDGTRFWGSGVMMAMRDRAGNAVGLLKIFRDQTAELHAKQALEQSRARLQEALAETERARAEAESANRAKDHFFAVLSHELRTPLTPIMFATDLLRLRDDVPGDVQDTVDMIRRNVELEARFVDDLLEVTRAARGKLEIVREPMDLHAAVAQAIDVCRQDFEAKRQHLAVSLAAPRHVVDGDFARLQQVVWNLLKNAAKFTPQGGRIAVATRNEDDRVAVEVSDTGIGIEPEVLPTVFDPFTQANAGITRQYGGLGLGLAIAKANVEAHGGELRARSEGRGHGATFTVSLPLREAR